MERVKKIFKEIENFIKTRDMFGISFSFKYNYKDNYSTPLASIFFLIFCLTSSIIFIINLIPFIKKENFNLQYYTINLNDTEPIKLKESPTAFAIGLDCPVDEKTKIRAEDLLDLKLSFITYTKDKEGNRSKKTEKVKTHPCNKNDFYNLYNESFDYLNIKNLQCLDLDEAENHEIKGIYTDQVFTYYEFTLFSKNDTEENFKKIDDYLIENDCKLQFYYTDIIVNITNYEEPIKSYIDSLFLQISPILFLKMNVFFMNYHFQDDAQIIDIFKHKEEPFLKTGFSRIDKYSLYKGLDRFSTKPYNYNNYAKLYIRVDNKKFEIKRKYQKLIEFYADNSSLLIGVFVFLNYIFSFYNNFKANLSISQKLFFTEGLIDNKPNNLSKINENIKSTQSSISMDNKEIKKIYILLGISETLIIKVI